MNGKIFKVILCLIIVICAVLQITEAKRSFGITARRGKSKSHSVRRGNHGHGDYDNGPVPGPKDAPKPSAPDASRPIGWNANNQAGHANTISGQHNQPMGPPPPYPGLGHIPVSGHGPPGYTPSFSGPPGYFGAPPKNTFSYGQNYGQPRGGQFAQSASHYGLAGSHHSPSYTPQQSPYFGNHVGGMGSGAQFGGMGNGVMPAYGYGYGHYKQSSAFSLPNILAGVALWQVARSVTGGHNRHVYHHYDKQPDDMKQAEQFTTLAPPGATIAPLQLAEYQNVDYQNRYGQVQYPMPTQSIWLNNATQTNHTAFNHDTVHAVPFEDSTQERLIT